MFLSMNLGRSCVLFKEKSDLRLWFTYESLLKKKTDKQLSLIPGLYLVSLLM